MKKIQDKTNFLQKNFNPQKFQSQKATTKNFKQKTQFFLVFTNPPNSNFTQNNGLSSSATRTKNPKSKEQTKKRDPFFAAARQGFASAFGSRADSHPVGDCT
jgi:hypothetical protein